MIKNLFACQFISFSHQEKNLLQKFPNTHEQTCVHTYYKGSQTRNLTSQNLDTLHACTLPLSSSIGKEDEAT